MSQEPWPCNGEDPWLSSKGRTMGVGKAVLCSHRPSSIVWSENGPCCRTIVYFVGGKRGEDLVWCNMSQTLSSWENHLVVFVCLGTYLGICSGICLEIYPAKKNIKKVMVSQNLRQTHLLEVDLTKTPRDHKTLISIVRHVAKTPWNFSSMKSSLDL